MKYRIGADIGGTFTDIVAMGESGFFRRKLLSTPDDYSIGIASAIRDILSEAGIPGTAIETVVNGTTVATNAILELKGAKIGLIITKGFRDILELRQTRTRHDPSGTYLIDLKVPKPLVPRYLRLEVDERINRNGEIVKSLNIEEMHQILQKFADNGVEAIAVSLLNSYANPIHEQKIGELVREKYSNIYLSLSSEVLRQIREYERTSTVVINAYVGPVVRKYLKSLRKGLDSIGIGAPLLVMGSSGGIVGDTIAAVKPMHIIESGPSAGVIASQKLAKRYNYDKIITLDMGGTTVKAAMIEGGEISKKYEYNVGSGISISAAQGAGYPLSVPTIDIAELGAGGGSIIWVDKGGLMRVGPSSAGAIPGPVCYEGGGTKPTLTDANVVMGYLNSEYLAGGSLKLNATKAHDVIEEKIAKLLKLPLMDVCFGSYLIATAGMTRAVKSVTTQRGRDPREFVLFAFGGSGPVYAAELARSLGIPKVIVPQMPGVFSAFGLILAEVEHNQVRTYMVPTSKIDLIDLERAFRSLEEEAISELRIEGYGKHDIILQRFVDMRYTGQTSELTIPISRELTRDELNSLEAKFHSEYKKTYMIKDMQVPMEIVNLRVIGIGSHDKFDPFDKGIRGSTLEKAKDTVFRKAYFGKKYGFIDSPILGRGDLIGESREGPFIVDEYDSTTVIPPMVKASLDNMGSIVIEPIAQG